MIKQYQLRVSPKVAADKENIKAYLSQQEGIDRNSINEVRILKKSIDARQRNIFVNLKVDVYINEKPNDNFYKETIYPDVSKSKQAIVVGAGPAGLFAALKLIEMGIKPIVVERGKDVRSRKRDIALTSREHIVNPESNYNFGEGGAGAFSDGKLYTRSKKRGSVEKILNVLCQHGADNSILYDAHPHIGTDKLPMVIENIRKTIINCGGEVHFETRMDALIMNKKSVVGIVTNKGQEIKGAVILATGHSARDVYRYLATSGIYIEPKGLAIGVRLEHPSTLIDQIQYHNKQGRGQYLPAAEYSFVTQSGGRGVYSFCMCPGGFVVPAASDKEQVVVNGMSPSNRGSKWSNSGMVVEIRPEDVINSNIRVEQAISKEETSYKLESINSELSKREIDHINNNILPLLNMQENIEKICWLQGGRTQVAPAQRMADFVSKRLSYDLPKTSYTAGVLSSPLHMWMPDFITSRLREGFQKFGNSSKGFLTNEAIMIGVETRTSSPIRILRDSESLQHIHLSGLYPCGEGAGYAGGIVSAAIDGERCAEALSLYLKQNKG